MKQKIITIVKGYLLTDKRSTFLTALFLCCVTVFLLTGNQLFENVRITDLQNARALEGSQHVSYYGITLAEFEKIKECSFTAQAGRSISLGQAEDGTSFAYIDENFRDLSAAVADGNLKQTIEGRWAEKENEAVFTKNYMEQHRLKLGDAVCINLTAADADTGEIRFCMPGLELVAVGVIDNAPGFMERKMGYVSEKLAESVIQKQTGLADALVRFESQENISRDIKKLNAYLGYADEKAEELNARKNFMLAAAAENTGSLKKQNRIMNLAVWLISAAAACHIFYIRLLGKKRDFAALRKIGFQRADLLKITGMEFLALGCMGAVPGMLAGILVNRVIYKKVLNIFVWSYDAAGIAASGLSRESIRNTAVMLVLIILPAVAVILMQLPDVLPADTMRAGKRNRSRKMLPAILTLSLSAVLASMLGIRDNQSDAGILYVKDYVPGDLQLTCGSIFENIMGGSVPSISSRVLQQIRQHPGVAWVQAYEINYDRGVFLCAEKQQLNPQGGYYRTMLDMEQQIDGKQQCLYNVILAADDNAREETGAGYAVMETGLAETLGLKAGDMFTLYDEPIIANASKKKCESVRLTLADTRNIILSESHLGGNLLIVDRETARAFEGSQSRQVINIWVKEGMEAAVTADAERLAQEYGCSFHSASRQMRKYADSDRTQKIMRGFFAVICASAGLLVYFNAVFTNLLGRRRDFAVMHKIGIRKKEMYGMVLKEGACHAAAAVLAAGIAQAALCAGSPGAPAALFAVADAGMGLACLAFPVVIFWYLLHRRMCW